MSFTYDPTNESDKDLVRFKLDDVVESELSIPDETIEAELTRAGTITGAILSCGQALYMKLLKKAREQELGSQKRRYGDRAKDLKELLDDWASNGVPGISEFTPLAMVGDSMTDPLIDTYKGLLGKI